MNLRIMVQFRTTSYAHAYISPVIRGFSKLVARKACPYSRHTTKGNLDEKMIKTSQQANKVAKNIYQINIETDFVCIQASDILLLKYWEHNV